MTLLLMLVVCPPALLTFCFGIELLAGVRPLSKGTLTDKFSGQAVIIVPAHNEELNIGTTLAALKEAASDRAQVLLVADNCTDSTAAIARKLRVRVAQRFDADRRGKGFALDFARQQLREDPPDVVIVVDADCTMATESVDRLVARCVATGRPCQASYMQNPILDGPPALQLSTFAFYIKNVVRQRALQRIAGRVHLLGTGMAFPWQLFETIALATPNIVEDLEIGLELTSGGHPPLSVEEAQIFSAAAAQDGTLEQRRRWEGGYLTSAVRWVPRTLFESIGRGDLGGVWATLDLLIPPIALLVLLDLGALIAAVLGLCLSGASAWPLLLLAGALLFATIALATAWASGGSRFAPLSSIARIPGYLIWKLPLYLGFARHGVPKEWLRTPRE